MDAKAFDRLDAYRGDRGMIEIELPCETTLFHAGQSGFAFDNSRTLWTATMQKGAEYYLPHDLNIGRPLRWIYELVTTRPIRLAVFPEFGNDFCLNFCNRSHNSMARTLTAWGNARFSLDGSSPLDGIKVDWEVLIFRAGDVLKPQQP